RRRGRRRVAAHRDDAGRHARALPHVRRGAGGGAGRPGGVRRRRPPGRRLRVALQPVRRPPPEPRGRGRGRGPGRGGGGAAHRLLRRAAVLTGRRAGPAGGGRRPTTGRPARPATLGGCPRLRRQLATWSGSVSPVRRWASSSTTGAATARGSERVPATSRPRAPHQ